MKTLKELEEHNINFLAGYTDALRDIVEMITDPKVYDPHYTGVLLIIDDYVNKLLEEAEISENIAANR